MKTEEIEVLVRSFTEDNPDWYVVMYRPKQKTFISRKFIHNHWRNIYSVREIGYTFSQTQPMLFSNYDKAMEYAKKIKANPELIEQHNQEQHDILFKKRAEKEKRFAEQRKCTII